MGSVKRIRLRDLAMVDSGASILRWCAGIVWVGWIRLGASLFMKSHCMGWGVWLFVKEVTAFKKRANMRDGWVDIIRDIANIGVMDALKENAAINRGGVGISVRACYHSRSGLDIFMGVLKWTR